MSTVRDADASQPEFWNGAWSASDFRLVNAVKARYPERVYGGEDQWPVYVAGVLEASAVCAELAKVFDRTQRGAEVASALREAQRAALAEVVKTVSGGSCDFAVARALVGDAT